MSGATARQKGLAGVGLPQASRLIRQFTACLFQHLEKSCRPCRIPKQWFIPALVKITFAQCFLSKLMRTKALELLNTTYNTMTEDFGDMIVGCRWILGGKLEVEKGFCRNCLWEKEGVRQTTNSAEERKTVAEGVFIHYI